MSRRYSRIAQAGALQQALTNYVEFVSGKTARQTKIGEGKAHDPRQDLYVIPFGYTLGTNDRLHVSASLTAWNTYKADFGSHTSDTLTTGQTPLRIRNVKPARVIIVTGRSGTGTVKESHITKMKYLSYGGTSRSIPFGRTGGTEVEEDAFATIKGAMTVAAGTRVTLQPEVVH